MLEVDVHSLCGGEVLAQDVICTDGVLLLKKCTRIRQAFVNKLVERNVQKVFISENVIEPDTPSPIISNQTRKLIGEELQKQFILVKDKVTIDADVFNEISAILLEEIPNSKVAYDILDIHVNDSSTYEHCITVAIFSALVAQRLNLPYDIMHQITVGALLHDVGKIIIPNDILNKPSRLTDTEFEVVKTHTTLGYQMIKDHSELTPISKLIVLCHHEREDGSGYPLGRAEDLHIGAKIVAACDIFDALITDRVYRRAIPLNQALLILRGEKISSEVRKSLEDLLEFHPIDSFVLLNTGEIAVVESNHTTNIRRPKVRTIYNLKNESYISKKIDLSVAQDINIIKKLDINEALNKILKNQPFNVAT